MKLKNVIAALLAAGLAISASAQDLKPVKDRDTKLFGYQDKSKNWVIAPSYDKAKRFIDGFAIVEVQGLEGLIDANGTWILRPNYNSIGKFDKLGLCEVMVKYDHAKYYGLSDVTGRLVLPVEYRTINVSRSDELIFASHEVESRYDGITVLWGVYDLDGNEIFEPQFSTSPTFNRGVGVAKSAYTGLEGVIDSNGSVLLPFDYLEITTGYGTRQALRSDFTLETFDQFMNKTDELRTPGSVIPYETAADDVRIASWHSGCVGRRLHSNNLKAAEITRDAFGRGATCTPLPLDWSYGRFIRLEPEIDTLGHPGCMEHPYNGSMYTLRALMYEADGTYVGLVSDWGWLEGEFAGGFIYNSEGTQKWIVFDDENYPARRGSFSVSLPGYNTIDNSNVLTGLGLGSADLRRLENVSNRVERIRQIVEGENVGVTSYLLRPEPRREYMRAISPAMRSPFFRPVYHLGDVVNCRVCESGDDVIVDLSDKLICHFEDRFHEPSYSMHGDELIYWGPNNARTVYLSLEPSDQHDDLSMTDDVYGSDRKYHIAICMAGEDGRFLRTLAEAPAPDFITDEVIVFEKLGIALIRRAPHFGPHMSRPDSYKDIRIPKSSRVRPVLSALNGGGGKPNEPGSHAPKPQLEEKEKGPGHNPEAHKH